MAQIEQKNLQKLTQIIKSSDSFKKAAKLLLSVSLFSFLFSYYSLYSFFLHSMSFDKNCVFLIFNGILVFIAKTSGSLQSRSGFDLKDHRLVKNIEDGLQMATESGAELSLLEKKSDHLEKEIEDHDDDQYYLIKEEGENRISDELKVENEEQDGKCGSPFDDKEGEDEHGRTFIDENGEEEIDSKSSNCLYEEAEEEEEEGGREEEDEEEGFKEKETNIDVLSTEELNKKFDEFIRRMKEEIRIEAQRTLIMV